eukprot:5628001-Amphidinium_carterae.1
MCSRQAFDQLSREVFHTKGIHVGVEDHTVSFGAASSQRSICTQQCVISFRNNGRLKLKFSIIEDGQAPFLFSLPQCLKLGARLELWKNPPSLEFMSGPFLGRPGMKLWKITLGSATELKRDLARRLQPSDGPLEPGERVFVWIQDSSKFKDRGRWEPGRVVGQEGAMVRVEVKERVQVVNQSKFRTNHDPWHDVPLPPQLMDAQAEDQSLLFMDVDVPDDQLTKQQGESSSLASAGDLSHCIRDLVQAIQDTFTIPKTKRENLKDKFDVRLVLFGAYTKQRSGCSHSCSKHTNVLKAIHRLAKTRPKQELYLAAQLNMSSGMSVHGDESNNGPSWTISFGTF